MNTDAADRVRKYIAEYEDAPSWGGPTSYPDPPSIDDLKAILGADASPDRMQEDADRDCAKDIMLSLDLPMDDRWMDIYRLVVERVTRHRLDDVTPGSADDERATIIRYLNEEAEDCLSTLQSFPNSRDMIELAISRCSYYRQAAAFIAGGEHHRTNRPRPAFVSESDRHTVISLQALQQIKHSIVQARILGNDWRRELALIENTVEMVLEPKGETQ